MRAHPCEQRATPSLRKQDRKKYREYVINCKKFHRTWYEGTSLVQN